MIEDADLRRVRETVKAVRRLQQHDQPDGRETLLEKVRRWQHLEMPDLPLAQVAHRARWAELYQQMRSQLIAAWPSPELVDIQHIGSSAIPPLRSKDIVDLAIAVVHTPPRPEHLKALASCGFKSYGQGPGGPDVHWFWKLDHPESTFVVHLCQADDPWWCNAIDFRDYLRAHPLEALRYEKRKTELATAPDRGALAYSLGKIELLLELNQCARLWREKRTEA